MPTKNIPECYKIVHLRHLLRSEDVVLEPESRVVSEPSLSLTMSLGLMLLVSMDTSAIKYM